MANTILKVLRSILPGARPTGRTYGELYINFADGQIGAFNSSNAPQDFIGVPIFSAAASYPAGQPVVYQNQLHIALVAITPGAFNPAQWSSAFKGGASTGDVKLTYKNVADVGWVMMNDGSIGDASSGSTTRANVDCASLFSLFYNNCTDANVPIQTSTGVATTRAAQGTDSAAWAAHCRLVLPKTLGRAAAIAGVGAGLTGRALGASAGAETHSQAVAELPPHNHSIPYDNGTASSKSFSYAGGNASDPFGAAYTRNAGSGTAMSILGPMSFMNVMVCL